MLQQHNILMNIELFHTYELTIVPSSIVNKIHVESLLLICIEKLHSLIDPFRYL